MTLPDELYSAVKYYYNLGLGRKVASILRKFTIENRESLDPEIMMAVRQCKEYLKTEENVYKNRVVITTHARLCTLTEEIVKQYQVIIDEDILSSLFRNIQSVPIEEIQRIAMNNSCPRSLRNRLNEVINAEEGKYASGQKCDFFHSIKCDKSLQRY